MYKPRFNRRQVVVFRRFGNKGYSLFSHLGREVVCSVLSVATLTYASAESVATAPVADDSTAIRAAREQMLEEVAVTGSRAPLTRSQAARMVTVLDAGDIRQAPVRSVNELLKLAAGVDVRQRGPLGAQTDISIRGGTNEQIIILLNGINICDPQTGHNVMDLPVDLSEILRVEVLEGPAGRIYGTSSLVGAINIVTRPAPTTSLDATAEGGSHGYGRLSGRANIRRGRWNNQLSGSYGRSDGYSRAASGRLNTDYSGAKAFYQGQYDAGQARLNWHLGVADKGWGSSTSYASPKWQADDQYEHTRKLMGALQADVEAGGLHLQPSLYWNQHLDRYEGYRGQPGKMKYNYNRTDVIGLNLNAYFDWTGGRTALGSELRSESLMSGNLGEPLMRPHHIGGTDRHYTLGLNRTNISGYLEHNLLLSRWTLSAGIVATKNTWSDMNITIYPGIDASYRPSAHWRLHASYNTSLRMPSYTEMYYKVQGYAADPHLKPEEMQALQIGASAHYSAVSLQCALWHHHGTNMIDWIMDTTKGGEAVWQSVNHTTINSTGVELGAAMQWPAASVECSYAYIAQDKEEEAGIVSQYALEHLRHKLTARADIRLGRRLALGVNARWQDRVGTYTDFDGQTHGYKPYFLADARLTWQRGCWSIYVEADNLLDKAYRDHGLVPQPGRWLVAGARLKL